MVCTHMKRREGHERYGKEIPHPHILRSTTLPTNKVFLKKKKTFPPPEEIDQHYIITQCDIVKGYEKAVKT